MIYNKGSKEWIENNLPYGVRLENIDQENHKITIVIELEKIADSNEITFPKVIDKLKQMEILGLEYEYIME